ncbi:MAG: DMT family transporter [Clostridiales bacterium]|nr:DMT family transporter [Clostridiales bacterium]
MTSQKNVLKIKNIILLFLTALIWGVAFVAQSVSMDYIQPLTFIFLRSLIGGLVLIPVIAIFDRMSHVDHVAAKDKNNMAASKGFSDDTMDDSPEADIRLPERKKTPWWKDKSLLKGGFACGICLFVANCFQQTGIQYTTVGKAGFITAFYIIIVPLLGIFLKRKCGVLTWITVGIALVGLYFLCINEELHIQSGDFLILLSALCFAAHIMVVDYFVRFVDGLKMSCIQFLTGAVFAGIGMLLLEEPQISMIIQAAGPILYTGVMSTGVGYTLQIIGQKGVNPTIAALILSLESVFSALSGFVILHQILSVRELIGCALMFTAIILAQLPSRHKNG